MTPVQTFLRRPSSKAIARFMASRTLRKTIAAWRLAFTSLMALLLTGCVGPSLTYRYRLTIEIDTPSGTKIGASILETTLRNQQDIKWFPPEARKVHTKTRGEAVFVDLGEGRHIIALLARGQAGRDDVEFLQIVPGSLGVRPYVTSEAWPAIAAASESKRKIDVPKSYLPTLVTFPDARNPDSAQVIEPSKLSGVFGPGYAFSRAYVELVESGWWPFNLIGLSGTPFTAEISKRLPLIVSILEERSKKSSTMEPNDPYRAYLGHLRRK
jgi:hypothetical protein